MARYFTKLISRQPPPKPEPKGTAGLMPFRRDPATAPMEGQDQLVGSHAQTVAFGGLLGGDQWMVGGTESDPATANWPAEGDWRTVCHGLTRLPPGHTLQIKVILAPSGLCDDGNPS